MLTLSMTNILVRVKKLAIWPRDCAMFNGPRKRGRVYLTVNLNRFLKIILCYFNREY